VKILITKLNKRQMEAQISTAIINFEKEYLGRGPKEIKTYIMKDLIIIRLKGVLTPAEEQLAKSDEGALLIKKTRVLLLESGKSLLKNLIKEITGFDVLSMHSDISTKTGERIIVFTLSNNLESILED